MVEEAAEAAAAIESQLRLNVNIMARIAAILSVRRPRMVLTCARGSSDHAATFGRYVLEIRSGVLTTSYAPSVSSLYRQFPAIEDGLCLLVSQSGRSPDLLEVAKKARDAGAFTIALTNDEGSPLAELTNEVIPLRAGAELSVAATKSYIASLFAFLQIAEMMRPRDVLKLEVDSVPDLLRESLQLDWSLLADRLVHSENVYVIGRGPSLGVAMEAALKLKETCNIHAEAFSAAEVRHGPMTLATKKFLVLVFRQDDESANGADQLARDLAEAGSEVFVVGAHVPGTVFLPALKAHPLVQPLLQIQTFYGMVPSVSTRRGLDPDRPVLLKKVTQTL